MERKGPNPRVCENDHDSSKDLADSLTPSHISPPPESWVTSPELIRTGLHSTPDSFIRRIEFLLENQGVNTSNLFRADILYDSTGVLKTPQEKERCFAEEVEAVGDVLGPRAAVSVEPLPGRDFPFFELKRTVVRRFIPRNVQRDDSLDQTCHFYGSVDLGSDGTNGEDRNITKKQSRCLVTYSPHCSSQDDIPFYHPSLRSLALLYDFDWDPSNTVETSESPGGTGSLSIHFLPFPPNPPTSITNRLARTLSSILSTHIRLSRDPAPSTSKALDINHAPKPNPLRDNLIPQHIVQNTYTRLKTTYSADLIRDWVEKTAPSKHVFEDLSIVAFLIELWRGMYGVKPLSERSIDEQQDDKYDPSFPGFVDIACGNGLLVYILLMEGYWGRGFDARRRKTWSIFPESVQERLGERICIPEPFKHANRKIDHTFNLGMETEFGIFNNGTFIISNHADELTLWTPLLAALSNPASPLPFLAIPCCSHSLSGARYRYPPPKSKSIENSPGNMKSNERDEAASQPSSGDLKALRASKIQAQTDHNSQSHQSSTYGTLTAKVVAVAEEIGIGVEKTKLRIQSTRNIGIVGGRRTRRKDNSEVRMDSIGERVPITTAEKVHAVVERECSRDGGVEAAAEIWVKRAMSLHQGQGRGKVNWGRKICDDAKHDEEHVHE